MSTPVRGAARPWMFLTSHAHVLLAVAAGPEALVDDLAERVGISKRQTLAVLRDLEESGYLERRRVGRRNRYTLMTDKPMRHPALCHHEVAVLLATLGEG